MNKRQTIYYEVKVTSNDGRQVHHVDRKFKNIEEIKKVWNFSTWGYRSSKFTVTRVVTERTEIINSK